ncbi:hydrogenase maturation protease [Beijerinckia indica]|uniref:Hydrogenase maturation protease n=1 Tax=Beijerinckia indica subsp. indica (strain ATCC 9039 / DSM 1715 / NCIMB 8712) TaxID=395963 RepID=B2IEX0_BEII9|nr:hydrogenase maturation protease [Beijerinckia indica]ACB94161.1 hydrogenase maturation protease [Beijerinckia indica subsp. indica ATCC 9039]
MTGAGEKERGLYKILVVGLGNPDRGDDGIGAAVIQSLTGRLPPDVALLMKRGDILSLIEEWSGINALICVDASAPMGTPGRIHRIDAAAGISPSDVSFTSSHAFGLAEVIALGQTLQLLPEVAIVYAIEGATFDNGAPMTPIVAAAARDVANRIVVEVERLRQNPISIVSGDPNIKGSRK